ncbi:MAG: class IV adenylate cyclase [Candidatus Binatus sp.]|uniref:class IV adenylate cyclase n=1 Tax=Candidatus Binatus sp. TaxID=2811406 RepID=UPI002720A3F6|nr:class IV adenylate cyclase [Candidatus Binatus sp.]MDO8434795.1 class IV adenylate cyclase [Candidatus Binatus sp.]
MKNLEAKFRLADLEIARESALSLGYTERATLTQRDTFFRVNRGKLKLREENGTAVLIYYNRGESGPLMLSNYEIVKVIEPAPMLAMMTAALGTIAVVEKERALLMRDNVRFHLDRVATLGNFGEIEAVIPDGDDPEHSRGAANELLAALAIAAADLIEVSYFEMLARP